MGRLAELFNPKIEYQLVEVEKPKPATEWNEDILRAIAALEHHPGFAALTERLRFQRSVLRSRLENEKQSHEDDNFVKSGIFWTGWLDNQVKAAQSRLVKPVTLKLTPSDQELFDQINSQIEEVGKKV